MVSVILRRLLYPKRQSLTQYQGAGTAVNVMNARDEHAPDQPQDSPEDGAQDAGDPQLRAELMKRLVSLSEALNRPTSVVGVAAAIGRAARSLSGAQKVAVYLRSPAGVVTCPWSEGLSPEYIAQVVTPKGANPWVHLAPRLELACMDLPKRRRGQDVEPMLLADTRKLLAGGKVRRLAEEEGFRAMGAWPLIHEGRVRASVGCYYHAPHAWSAPEREVMQTFSWQAAAALENGRLFEAQRQRTAELEALFDLGSRLRAAHAPEEMYPILVDRAVGLLHADHGALTMLSPDRETLLHVHTAGVVPEPPGSAFPAAGSVLSRVVETGASYLTDDWAQDAHAGHLGALGDAYRVLGPVAIVAVRSEREVIGAITVGRARDGQRQAFTEVELRLLKGIAEMAGTAIHRSRLHQTLEASYIQMVLTLARAMDTRDAYTGGHSERLADWAEAAARLLGSREEEIRHIRWGALLHDIGKIGIPDAILKKPGKLTDEEWAVMRQHPIMGEEILRPVQRMHDVARIVRHHHERWDGTGYPDGLKERAIPLGARILSVVDSYSAITDARPYKPARSHEDAVAELRRCAGAQFDPRVVEACCQVIERERQRA